MKKTILLVAGMIAFQISIFSQCDKKVTITSSATEYLDSTYTVQRTVPEKTLITIDKTSLTIAPPNQTMTGRIQSITCDWKTPFKEGKTIIHTVISDPRRDKKNGTITIEGKNGKVTLLVELAEMRDRKIRITADTFQESN